MYTELKPGDDVVLTTSVGSLSAGTRGYVTDTNVTEDGETFDLVEIRTRSADQEGKHRWAKVAPNLLAKRRTRAR